MTADRKTRMAGELRMQPHAARAVLGDYMMADPDQERRRSMIDTLTPLRQAAFRMETGTAGRICQERGAERSGMSGIRSLRGMAARADHLKSGNAA